MGNFHKIQPLALNANMKLWLKQNGMLKIDPNNQSL